MEATDLARAIEPWTDPDAANLTAQLGVAIRHAIANGLLQRGDRLPPERAMAKQLHVSRPTISAVIDELRRSGFVTSRQGSGSWIAHELPGLPTPIPFNEQIYGHGLIDLAAATAPDASMLPPVRLDEGDLLATDPSNGLAPAGLETFRTDLAAYLRRWHRWVDSDNLVVTSGAHQALALLIAALVPRGASVLIEEVTYGGLVDLVTSMGAKPIPIPRDSDGPDPAALRRLLSTQQPAMTVLVASVHSPTGSISTRQRCADLASVLRDASGHIVIDETYADLEFEPSGRHLARELAATCILTGSLSKTAWLGLRTGWIAAPVEVAAAVTARRWQQFDLGPSIPNQIIARQILRGIDDLVARRRTVLEQRATWLHHALEEAFPDWELTPVEGGLALWARLPGADSSGFAERAAARGVAVLTGSACRADRGADPHVRLCFDREIPLLAEAVQRL